jgi:AcrR family transcriptional regulator
METTRSRRKITNRQKILDAARVLLMQNGVAGLSMRTLADAVDYSPAAVYKYFRNKEAILKAIQAEGWTLAAQVHTEAVGESHTPPEILLGAARGYLLFAVRYPEHYLLMFDSPHLAPPTVADISKDQNFSGLIAIISDGVAGGFFQLPSGFTPELMAFIFWTSAHGMAMIRINYLRNAADEFDRLCDRMISTFIDGITIRKRPAPQGRRKQGKQEKA